MVFFSFILYLQICFSLFFNFHRPIIGQHAYIGYFSLAWAVCSNLVPSGPKCVSARSDRLNQGTLIFVGSNKETNNTYLWGNFIAGKLCVNTLHASTSSNNTIEVKWVSSENPRLDFRVRTSGVARLSIRGATYYPKVNIFIGVDETVKYKGMVVCLLIPCRGRGQENETKEHFFLVYLEQKIIWDC